MPSPHLDLLTATQSYQSTREGEETWKACLWNLTKARRASHTSSLAVSDRWTASSVREQLRAQVRLECSEPALVAEGAAAVDEHTLVLVNVWKELQLEDNIAQTSTSGLRQRKKTTKQNSTSTMKEDHPEEELRWLQADPLTLWGAVAPKELRIAQANARAALANYVQAAARVQEIQRQLLYYRSRG